MNDEDKKKIYKTMKEIAEIVKGNCIDIVELRQRIEKLEKRISEIEQKIGEDK